MKLAYKFFRLGSTRLFPLVGLAILIMFSVGKTARYYFFSDDYAYLYSFQRNAAFTWPYTYSYYFLKPLYDIFGFEASPFFIMGVITFFMAAMAVFFLLRSLTGNTMIASLSCLLFASGYIGVDHFTMFYSNTEHLNIILICIVVTLFIRWIDSRNLWFYFAAIGLYWLSIYLLPFRAFTMLILLPAIDLILTFKRGTLRKVIRDLLLFVLRCAPLVLIAKMNIIPNNSQGTFNTLTNTNMSYLKLLIEEIFVVFGKFVLFEPIFFKYNLFYNRSSFLNAGVSLSIIILLIGLICSFSKEHTRIGKSLLFFWVMTVAGYVGVLMLNPTFDSNGTNNRYLLMSGLAYVALLPILFYLLSHLMLSWLKIKQLRLLPVILTLPIAVSMFIYSREFQQNIIETTADPARNFFAELRKELPELPAGKNVFLFDRADYYPNDSRFGRILMSAAWGDATVLAAFYNIPIESAILLKDFQSLELMLKNNEIDPSHIHTFYYDEKGLQQTTDKVLPLLQQGEKKTISLDHLEFVNTENRSGVKIPLSLISTLTSMNLRLRLKISEPPLSFFHSKFKTGSSEEDNSLFFSYLLSRQNYYKTVKIKASSSHEVYEEAFAIDDSLDTWWLPRQYAWNIEHSWLQIDLNETRQIGALLLSVLIERFPTEYEVFNSLDGRVWSKITNISTMTKGAQIKLTFTSKLTRFIKIKINSTKTGIEPGFAEIEAIEDQYKNIDLEKVMKIKNNPLLFVQNENNLRMAYDYLKKSGQLILNTWTNRDISIENTFKLKTPIYLDSTWHEYNIRLEPRGTELKELELALNFPAKIELAHLEINHLSSSQLSRK